MLIIVNPYATTVSDRLKSLVVYALQGRYEVEAVSTEAQNHATEIGREAINGGYDIVVAFGGDGTLNEVANGLAGTDIPVSVLPGGSTNVVARTLGIPNDVVDATEHLLGCADASSRARSTSGSPTAGASSSPAAPGLDATAAQQVDSRPRMKHRFGPYFYTWAAVRGFYSRYLRDPVRMSVECDGGREPRAITAICQNSDPFTYFRGTEVRVCEDVAIDSGTLSLAVLRRAAQRDVPFIAARVLGSRSTAGDHRQIDHFEGLTRGADRVRARATRTAPGGPSRSRSTATTSASTASSTSAIDPRRAAGHRLSRGGARSRLRSSARSSPARSRRRSSSTRSRRSPSSTIGRCSPATSCSSPASTTRRSRTCPRSWSARCSPTRGALAAAVREAMGAQGTFVAMNNVVSQSVPHLHVHIVPRNRKDGLRGFFWPRTRTRTPEQMARRRRGDPQRH